MTTQSASRPTFFSPLTRLMLGSACLVLVFLLLIGAGSMPFVFESQSLRYKFGTDRIMLRSGQVLGMLAATLLLLQLVLAARFKFLDRIFGLNTLYTVHRVSAVAIAVLAVLHPLLVFAPEDIANLPPQLKYWPEILGAALLLTLWTIISSALFRRFLALPFNLWWLAHRAATFTAAVMVFVHILYVSDSFEYGLPRLIVFGVAFVWGLVLIRVRLRPFLNRKNPYTVKEIGRAGRSSYSVELAPPEGGVFPYLPGQFAFVSFRGEDVAAEEHPFTISSSPTRPESLQFSILCSGDWTSRIGRLRRGDRAVLDGPYGLFSHLVRAGDREIVMVAGGIGITPMLSMLRYLADTGDSRRITLIWSNRGREDKIYEEEFRELADQLPGLAATDVFTREGSQEEGTTRLDGEKLEKLLVGCDRQAAVFICGPLQMMREMKRNMLRLGFKRHLIHLEEFAL